MPRNPGTMSSVSKTGKLLQYINYRECRRQGLGTRQAARSPLPGLSRGCCTLFTAGMRVTVTDGRQIVGR